MKNRKQGKRIIAWVLRIGMVFVLTSCGGPGTGQKEPEQDTKQENNGQDESPTDQNGKGDTDQQETAEITMGTITYSHGCIEKPWKYPYWEAKSKDLATGEVKDLVVFDDRAYIDGDEEMEAFFSSDSQSYPSATHDMLFVYTMPFDATVQIEVITRVHSEQSNGITAYCYVNDTSKYLLEPTVVTWEDDVKDFTYYEQKLKKGDVLYCGYGANGDATEDAGNFYVKMTYVDIE